MKAKLVKTIAVLAMEHLIKILQDQVKKHK